MILLITLTDILGVATFPNTISQYFMNLLYLPSLFISLLYLPYLPLYPLLFTMHLINI